LMTCACIGEVFQAMLDKSCCMLTSSVHIVHKYNINYIYQLQNIFKPPVKL